MSHPHTYTKMRHIAQPGAKYPLLRYGALYVM
nr:MAG TPA: hypothetical protein [Caudoviricetes sp.]